MRNLCNNKKVSKLPHLSKFVDDLSQQSCKKDMSDRHIVLKSPDLSCETYLSTPQMVASTVTSQHNLKNMLHLTRSAEIKKVSKFPTCQSYPALPYTFLIVIPWFPFLFYRHGNVSTSRKVFRTTPTSSSSVYKTIVHKLK